MALNFFGRLTAAACVLLLSLGCEDSTGGAGGTAGTGATGGAQPPAQIPGLWQGGSSGVAVCFFVDADGRSLRPNQLCNVTAADQSDASARSFDLSADMVGTDAQGAPCSLELGFESPVAIDPLTGVFNADTGTRSFSGQITGELASGIAAVESDGSICRVGWSAKPSAQCDDEAIQSCLDLQDCCRAILVNPVFFESCNSVVLQCDQQQCLNVLAGYPSCAPEPQPDAGIPDAGAPDAGTPDGG